LGEKIFCEEKEKDLRSENPKTKKNEMVGMILEFFPNDF